ncbi:hypothetical protein [Sphingomonas fennica]|nr:hypothetical protein [Sphingomonas fennica]
MLSLINLGGCAASEQNDRAAAVPTLRQLCSREAARASYGFPDRAEPFQSGGAAKAAGASTGAMIGQALAERRIFKACMAEHKNVE